MAAALTAVLLLSGIAYATTRLTERSWPAGRANPSHHAHRRSLRLIVRPGSATVTAGTSTRVRLLIYERGYRAAVHVEVTGLPAGARAAAATLAPPRSGAWAHGSLVVTTAAATPARAYRIMLAATRARRSGRTGRRHLSATFRLTVRSPARSAFVLRGDAPAPLAPGASEALDVALQNPNPYAIVVRAVSVNVTGVAAPRADRGHPCAAADFATTPLAAPSGVVVAARAAARLRALGLDPALWPHLAMVDRPSNQDGCKGATLRLSYTGTATKAP